MRKTLLTGAVLLGAWGAIAQTDSVQSADSTLQIIQEQVSTLKGQVDGINESYLGTQSTVDKLAKIKISGYIQAQFRYATDTTGQLKLDEKNNLVNKYNIGEFQGGNLPAVTQSVFQLRRARVKVAYETPLTQAVVQLDCLPFTTTSLVSAVSPDTIYDALGVRHIVAKAGSLTTKTALAGGGVTIKDAYLRFTEPWIKSVAVKMGVFDRPFGFEISYSSSNRESPERSRVFQTLFPGERDLGVSLEYLPADNLPLWAQYFNIKAGLFSGNGINIEIDDNRDFIGRLGFSVPFRELNIGIDGGVSKYVGKVKNYNDTIAEIVSGTTYTKTAGTKRKDYDRDYTGIDLQAYYGDVPFLGGITVRGEYILGKQPGTSSASGSTKSDLTSSSVLYLREFAGYYGMVVLNIDPIKCQLVGKYDVYDPNTKLAGNDVTSSTDIAMTTIGGGLVYHWDDNVKLVAYYDQVSNDVSTAVAAPFTNDVNDNVFTFRVQYKF